MTDSTARQTQSGSVSVSGDDPNTSRVVLAVVLNCGQPSEDCVTASLDGIDLVRIGRGATRRCLRKDRELIVELTDPKVSTHHAEIDCREGYWLHDLGSTNGTFLGSARVVDVPIDPGAIFRVGQTFLSLVAEGVVLPSQRAVGGAPAASPAWPFSTSHGGYRRELDRLERIAPSPIPVLLLGETGSGKEVLARATHERSGRPGPFVAVNCGALPAALVESLLFGHRKGAFSGATSDALGFVRRANRGTLFLDEIGDLPLAAQVTLLRVLQEREVIPVGATEPERVDIRVLAATHRPLEEMVEEGRFRADLLSRLSGVVLRIPALRERRADLGTLIAHMLGERASQVRFRPETGLALLRYSYPHNIRELSQALEASVVLSGDGILRPGDLPEPMRGTARSESAPPPARILDEKDQQIHDELVRRLGERGGNISQVARDMGKTRQQVQRWVRRFGLVGKE